MNRLSVRFSDESARRSRRRPARLLVRILAAMVWLGAVALMCAALVVALAGRP